LAHYRSITNNNQLFLVLEQSIIRMNHPAYHQNNNNHYFAGGVPTTTVATTGWFAGAPWTKCISLTLLVVFVIMRAQQPQLSFHHHHHQHLKQYPLAVDYQKILQGEAHRWITGKLTFATSGELVMGGSLLVILLRKFEREVSCCCCKTTMECVAL
jgi:hypothetical protein